MRQLIFIATFFWITTVIGTEELPLVVIIPSYNNEQWHYENLNSILSQENYLNYRIIYINDCSKDDTGKLVAQYLDAFDTEKRVTLINNSKRRGAMANIYDAVHSCADDEIVLLVDGDDKLAHNQVLSYINTIYKTEDVWLTYGQYQEWPGMGLGFNAPFTQEVIAENSFRKAKDCLPVSHMRTFYAWLFKQIKKDDLMYEGDFYLMTWDKAIMAPMLEMCGFRHKCITDVLYIYNNNNPLNDHRVNKELQMDLMYYILDLPPYQPLKSRPI